MDRVCSWVSCINALIYLCGKRTKNIVKTRKSKGYQVSILNEFCNIEQRKL